ncbi:keratin-associated protein 5-1-like [Venturia canescens]|uniref:keratin-associated protein 5-1-like n=1 Tax=Venturia canescens TaxID=32260 RepID=UPI001C9D302C|nr:keratin-associated protein 5-1-like [Venturia canescens]
MPIFEDRDAARFDCGYGGQLYNSAIREERARGGCGSCGGQAAVNPVSYRNAPISKKARFPCDGPPAGSYGAASQPKMKGACPCGGCGGPACSEDPDRGCAESADFKQPASGGCGGTASSQYPRYGEKENREEKSGGCCKTSRPRGNPCKCKCQSCEAPEPNGGCGGGSCGMMYSCSGSSAGRCCFPRNTKRRSGPECCGGGDPSCGGCC